MRAGATVKMTFDRHAGKGYESLLKERVLQPLGLSSTAITMNTNMASRLAPGHNRYLQPVDTWEMKTLQASGSLAADQVLTVIRKRDRLLIDYVGDGNGLEFLAAGARDFFYSGGDDEITFQVESNGRVAGLWLHDNGKASGLHRVATREYDRTPSQ